MARNDHELLIIRGEMAINAQKNLAGRTEFVTNRREFLSGRGEFLS